MGGASGSGSLQTDGRGPLWCPIHNCFTPPGHSHHTLYVQYMRIAVYTVLDGHVCLVYSTGGNTHKVHFHLCTYVYMQLVSHISHWVTTWAPTPCVYVSTCFHLRYGASLVVLSEYCCCMYYRQQLFPPPTSSSSSSSCLIAAMQ